VSGKLKPYHLAMQPFQKETGMIAINSGSSDTTVNNFVVIPSGKRLIIETIFGRCYFGAPNEVHMFEIGTTIKGSPEVRHMLPQIMIATNACLIFGSVRLYADPKTAINLYISRNVAAGDSTCHISLSGHFVDV